MIKYTRTFIAILAAIATAFAFAGCPTSTSNNGDDNDYGPIVETETVLTSGGISFTIPAGLVREAQLAAITALVNGLDVTEFEDYVSGVNFANVPTWNVEVSEGENSKATITLPINVTAEQIAEAFEGAQEMVAIERARAEREAKEELARQASVIAELSAEFAGYISNITFADVEVPGYELDENSDPVTASVILPNNFTAEQGRAFIEDTVMESINDARDPDELDPFIIIEGIRFYAEEGIDVAPLKAELAITNVAQFAPFVSSWTRTHTGGRHIDVVDDKAVIRSDGSVDIIGMDLLAGGLEGRREERMEVLNLIAKGYTMDDIRRELEAQG